MSEGSFGPFNFDRRAGALTRDGSSVALGTRAAALLTALIDADGAPVTKDALFDAAWPGATVEESNLAVQIAGLRKALGRRSDGQEWIATVPRVGYRLLRPKGSPAVGDSADVPLLAVLPFHNLSPDREQDYFAEGVVEDLITALSRFRSIAVVARSSSFVYKGRALDVRHIARELNVQYILDGGVRRAGNQLRITAQLIDAGTGAHLWAEAFDGATDEIFDFQDRIAGAVAGTVEPRIQRAEIERSRRERPKSIAGYDLYLRALSSGVIAAGAAGSQSAVDLLTAALELEPENATYLGTAIYIHYLRWYMGWVPEPDPRLPDYIERALRHAQGDATVLARCADALLHVMRDDVRAMESIRYALELNPHSFIVVYTAGVINLHSGDLDEALGCFRHALTLSPRDPRLIVPITGIAHVAMIRGDYPEAVRCAERALAINAWFRPAYWMLIAAHAFLGNTDNAKRYLAELRTMEPSVSLASIRATQPDNYPDRMAGVFEGLRLAGMSEA